MAGLPPLAGFVAKESVYGALIGVARHGDGTGLEGASGWAILLGVVLGSALTVAYTARFLWGAFATKPGSDPSRAAPIAAGFLAAPAVLAALSVGVGFAGGAETAVLTPYADAFPPDGSPDGGLALWHGLGLPLALSAVSLGFGLLLVFMRDVVAAAQTAFSPRWSAERGYFGAMRLLDRSAVEVTAVTQRGSVTTYLSVILAVVVLFPGPR